MNTIQQRCDVQFFVCVNQRSGTQSLPSCGAERGQTVYDQLKLAVAPWARKLGITVWVNRSLCQGFCSPHGVTVCVFPGQIRVQAMLPSDIPGLLAQVEKALLEPRINSTR